MDRRKLPDRRKVHVFVANERRTGPSDRRNADARRRERAEEREKINQIRRFKDKDTVHAIPAAASQSRRRQLVIVGVALLLLVVIVLYII